MIEMNEATWRWVEAHRADDVRLLALRDAPPGVDKAQALQQIAGWQVARTKLLRWAATAGILFPPHLALEQCSSQATAAVKAELAAGDTLVDLTGGLGVDFAALAPRFKRAVYVERQHHLCELARHNFPLLGLSHASVVEGAAEDYLARMETVDWIFLDPARRDEGGGRVYDMAACEPSVPRLLDVLLARGRRVMVKLSPMYDWHRAADQLRHVETVMLVGTAGECKELLLVLRAGHEGAPALCCVSDGERFTPPAAEVPPAPLWDGEAGTGVLHLYEPNATVMKASCFDALAAAFGLEAVGRNSHLFVSRRYEPGFPGRKFVVSAITTMNKKELRATLAGVTRANVAVRNFPLKAPELARRLHLKDGGDVYIFATRLEAPARPLLLLCRKA